MRRDVVLLLEADGPDGYAFGLVTNQPTASPLGAGPLTAPRVTPASAYTTGGRMLRDELAPFRRTREDDLTVFNQSHVFYGGPDGGWNLTMLHPFPQVRGSVIIRDGLCYGGDLAHAASLVRQGEATAADFCFYRGRVDWQPGLLRGECRLGEWVVAEWDDTGGGSWPPPGLMPRLAWYAASAADVQLSESISDLGTAPPGRLRSYKLAAWAHVVAAVADGAAQAGDAASVAGEPSAVVSSHGAPLPSEGIPVSHHPLRSWLRLHPLEASEIDALHGGREPNRRRMGAPPAWRTQEDWGVSEKWPGEA
jgi:hypothetical protein